MNQNISLEQLIPNPKSLRLLILHTPFPLSLTPLQACYNLIKLDVSNNNLSSVPCLGHLSQLRFLFLHNNRLDFEDLRLIFSEEPDNAHMPQSNLAKHIVWVTFWGNKNCFYARHFLINNTSAIAVDKNLVVEEEKSPNVHLITEPFSPPTKIEFPLLKLEHKPDGFSEEEYIASFYVELAMLRSRYLQVNPFVAIQRVVRGWLVRLRIRRAEQSKKHQKNRLLNIFSAWKRQANNIKRLKEIAERRGKSYLVGDLKQYKRQLINQKCIAWARDAKARVRVSHTKRRLEVRLKSGFLRTYYSFQVLFEAISISLYSKMYILASQASTFRDVIFPFVERNGLKLAANIQTKVYSIRAPLPPKSTIPYVNILAPGVRANLIIKNLKSINRKRLFAGIRIRPVEKVCHLSSFDRQKSNRLFQRLCRFQEKEAAQMLQIDTNEATRKAICRAVVLYNKGRLQPMTDGALVLVPEKVVLQNSASLNLQKLWRGYQARKAYRKQFLQDLGRARAAIRIQRWVRRLPSHHRRKFLSLSKRLLNQFIDCRVILQMDDYLRLEEKAKLPRMKFIGQYAEVCTGLQSCSVGVRWSHSSTSTIQQTILTNKRIGLPLFSAQLPRYPSEIEEYATGSMYSLLHVRTKSKILEVNQQKFIMVEFPSVKQLKSRIFGLLLLTYNFRTSNSSIVRTSTQVDAAKPGQSKIRLINNADSMFLYCQSTRYFEERAKACHLPIVRLPLLIYLKDKRNPYPFKVQDTVSYVNHTNIDISDNSAGVLPTFFTEVSGEDSTILPQRLTIRDLLNGAQFRRSEQQIPGDGRHQTEFDSKERAVSSHFNPNRVDRLVRKRKPQKKYMKELKRTSIGDHLQTHYKTEQSSLSVQQHLKSDNRMLKTQTSRFEPTVGKRPILHRPKNLEQQTFTSNFISMSNFISKQAQLNHIRQHRRNMHSQLSDAVADHRQKTEKSKERMNQTLRNQTSKIRQKSKDYKEEIATRFKQLSVPRLVEHQPKKKKTSKGQIYVVFPQECFPLEPN